MSEHMVSKRGWTHSRRYEPVIQIPDRTRRNEREELERLIV